MLIVKDGVYRSIRESAFSDYAARGYRAVAPKKVPAAKQDGKGEKRTRATEDGPAAQ